MPADPAAPARKAAVMMWVLGALGIVFGFCVAAVFPTMLESMMNSSMPEAQQMRQQFQDLEAKSGVSLKTQLFVTGLLFIGAGGVLGIVAFFVRGGGRASAVTGIVLVSLGLIYLAINLLASVAFGGGNPAQLLVSLCFVGGLMVLLGMTLRWLIQATRNAPMVQAAKYYRANPGASPPPGSYPPGAYPPAGYPGYPPYGGYPQQPSVPPPAPGNTFGHAPFGIPPPPDQAGGKYGYATKPPESQPPAKDDEPRTE